jgi:hypothetical protein
LIAEPEERDLLWIKASKSRARDAAIVLRDDEGRVLNGRGARGADEASRLQEVGSPWTGRTLDVVAGWNKPVKSGPEQTAERLRKSEGGT